MYLLQQQGPDSFTIINQDGEVVAWVRGAEIAGIILNSLNKEEIRANCVIIAHSFPPAVPAALSLCIAILLEYACFELRASFPAE